MAARTKPDDAVSANGGVDDDATTRKALPLGGPLCAAPVLVERPEPEATDCTLRDSAREWIEHYVGRTARGIDDSTRMDYRRSLERHAIAVLGDRQLADLAARDIRALVRHLEQDGQAPSSVRKHLAPLKAL